MKKTLYFTLAVEANYDTPDDDIEDLIEDTIDNARQGVRDDVY